MSTFQFVHAADLHLDSPLRGLAKYESAPAEEFRGATRRAVENLVQLCLDQQVGFLVIAGDVYDGAWRDFNTGLFFSQQMSRLRAADIPVVLIRGNHDAQSSVTKHLKLPTNVVELSTRQPETYELKQFGVAIHGQGYATQEVVADLSQAYPRPRRDLFNLGLLHTCVDGRPGYASYAPCSLSALQNYGYDYWALGHVHEFETLSQEPWIGFAGNTQGRHIRETGPKGCLLVTVTEGSVTSVQHKPLDVARWARVVVPVWGLRDREEVLAAAQELIAASKEEAGDRALAIRLVLQGRTSLHHQLVLRHAELLAGCQAVAADEGGGQIWLEKVQLATLPEVDLDALIGVNTPAGQLLGFIHGLEHQPELGNEIWECLKDLRGKIPGEVVEQFPEIDLSDATQLSRWLPEIAELIVPQLVESEESP